MKQNLIMALLLGASLTSCINDADVVTPETSKPELTKGNLSFSLVIPNALPGSRSAEDSGIHHVGSADEYEVKNVCLYLFNADTGNLSTTLEIDNLGNPTVSGEQVTYGTSQFVVKAGKYRILAVANGKKAVKNSATLDGMLANIDKTTYAAGLINGVPSEGILMTNRGGDSPVPTIEVDKHSHVTIVLERALAKVLLAKSKPTYELKDNEGSVYANITPTNYDLVNLSKEYYLFRHVATFADAAETPAPFTAWEIDKNFGMIPDVDGYAVDPNFFVKRVADVETFNGRDYFVNPLQDVDPSSFQGTFSAAGSSNYTGFYCLENTAFRPAQYQVYSTGAVIKANLTVPAEHCFNNAGDQVAPMDQPNTLYYFNYDFYTSLEAVKTQGQAKIPANSNPTDEELAKYDIKRFTKTTGSYNCYYNYWIKHLDNKQPTHMGVMEYGIVRNNIYEVTVTNVKGLGTGTPDTKPTPDEDKGFLDVDLSVMPWIVRSQDAELE